MDENRQLVEPEHLGDQKDVFPCLLFYKMVTAGETFVNL
jgi:hypothetical protein